MNVETGGFHVMQVDFLEEGRRLIARPHGRMEAADGVDFASAIERRLQSETQSVTIDLEALKFVNFGAIRALLRLARSLKAEGRQLEFLGGNLPVREALDQAGFDDFFPFTPPYVTNRGIKNATL